MKYPTLGVDLDGTITDSPEFFKTMMGTWPGRVIVVTYREHLRGAIDDLADFDYDEVVLAPSMDKSSIIIEKGIDVFIDDQDEMIYNIPEHVTVMKIRNGGNFDYDEKKWLYSEETGRMI